MLYFLRKSTYCTSNKLKPFCLPHDSMIRAQISTSHGVSVNVDSSPDNNDSMVCLNITDVTSRHGMWLTEIEIDDTMSFVPLRTDFFQEKEAASSTLTRIQLSPASHIFILQPTIAMPITFLRSLERFSNSATTFPMITTRRHCFNIKHYFFVEDLHCGYQRKMKSYK